MAGRSEPPLKAVSALGSSAEPGALVLVLCDPITRTDTEWLCDRLRSLLGRSEAALIICDVAALASADVATVGALARLQLTARRYGGQIRLRHACDELRDLLALLGLTETVPLSGGPEPGRQTEEGKQVLGVEKRVDPGDPPG
jgi:ABC-type transporter Mla MlaB component